jgi:SH3 domain-containing YSC84-like protein 1
MNLKFARKIALVITLFASVSILTYAKDDNGPEAVRRMDAAANVLDEIMAAPDKGIPRDVFNSAKCVAVVPGMKKAGFIVGGKYGKGFATCRTADGGWSAPAPIVIGGGSWGLQIGGEEVDLVMLIMNQKGMDHLLASKFELGADGSVAAGPVGRQAEANTDWKMRAEVLSYSRTRGIFGGLELNGAVIKQDNDDSQTIYGDRPPFKAILAGQVPPPQGSQHFLAVVQKYAAEARADKGGATQSIGQLAKPDPRIRTRY